MGKCGSALFHNPIRSLTFLFLFCRIGTRVSAVSTVSSLHLISVVFIGWFLCEV
jgi:hypothetical protein